MIKFGIVSEMDAQKGLARVYFEQDDIVSDWLRVSIPSGLKNKDEIWLDVNEFVWCLMDENCEDGLIGGAYYNDSSAPAVGNADVRSVTFADGTRVSYNRQSGEMVVDCKGSITLKADGNLTIQGDVSVTGDVNITGNMDATGVIKSASDVKAGIISLITHKHSGVTTGGGVSGPSIP